MEEPGGCSHLDEGHGAVGVAEGLYHGLGGHQVGDAVRGRGLRGLLVLEGVEQVLAPVLLVAVLHDGPQGLGPGHLPAGRNRAWSAQGSVLDQPSAGICMCVFTGVCRVVCSNSQMNNPNI